MFRKMISLVSLVLVLVLVGDVQAEWYDWTNADPGDQLWSTPGNWSGGIVPIAGDGTNLNLIPGPIVDPTVDIALDGGALGVGGADGELTMDGGTVAYNWFNLGEDGGTTGTLNMNSGTLTANWDIGVGAYGEGIVNMTGGTLGTGYLIVGAWGGAGATGHIALDGGTIDVEYFLMRIEEGAVGTMDIEAGTLISNNDLTGTIQGYIDNGWITGYGGAGEAIVSYDGETTTLYAVPEPATMCLLGLGGLLLRRRRSA